MKLLVLGLLSLTLWQGCSSLSKEECQVGNWYEYGRRDGTAGDSSGKLADHQKACTEYGVTPNKADYMKGYNEGLKSYCTFDNGKVAGERGRSDNGVCVGGLSREYARGITEGKKIYEINRKISDVEKKIADQNTKLQTVDGEIAGIEQKRLSTKNVDSYKLTEYELRDKNSVKAKIQAEVEKLEKQKAELEEKKLKL